MGEIKMEYLLLVTMHESAKNVTKDIELQLQGKLLKQEGCYYTFLCKSKVPDKVQYYELLNITSIANRHIDCVINLACLHKYTYRSRGYSPGCQPMSGLVQVEANRPYEILTYNRKLSNTEIDHYELKILE
jgi:hypothetical protein